MNKIFFFKSEEKKFFEAKFGKKWNSQNILSFLWKIVFVVYIVQLFQFNFDYFKPFYEGFVFYLVIVLIYFFSKNIENKRYYFKLSGDKIEVYENNVLMINILINNISKIVIKESSDYDKLNKYRIIDFLNYFLKKINWKWQGIVIKYNIVSGFKKDKSEMVYFFSLNMSEISKLKKIIKNNEIINEKIL